MGGPMRDRIRERLRDQIHDQDDDRLSAEVDPTTLLTLHDPQTVRLKLPPLTVGGTGEPLHIHLDFGAEMVGILIGRLKELQARMTN